MANLLEVIDAANRCIRHIRQSPGAPEFYQFAVGRVSYRDLYNK